MSSLLTQQILCHVAFKCTRQNLATVVSINSFKPYHPYTWAMVLALMAIAMAMAINGCGHEMPKNAFISKKLVFVEVSHSLLAQA